MNRTRTLVTPVPSLESFTPSVVAAVLIAIAYGPTHLRLAVTTPLATPGSRVS